MGRVEKIDSVAASFAASSLTLALGGTTPALIRCTGHSGNTGNLPWNTWPTGRTRHGATTINGYCQQALIEEGMSAKKAAEQLKGIPAKDLHEMMHVRGFNLATTPAWQRRGVLVYKKITEKEGFNPITQETVVAERSAVTVERDLPLFTSPEGKEFLGKLVVCP